MEEIHQSTTSAESTEPKPEISSEISIPEGAVDISSEKNGGIWKLILNEGQGEAHPATGDTCYVHYVGTLLNGMQFDSSRDRGEEFSFKVGRSQVIKGWDATVATMKKGEKCKIILQPDYGYGAMGSAPRIPPNATLTFEIELIRWEGEDISPDKDKSILRSVLKEGEKYDTPGDGSKIDANIVGWYNGREFVNADIQFILGEASEVGLPDGFDKAFKRFHKGERSMIHLKPRWGYGKEGNAQYQIPSNAEIDFEVELKNFEKAKNAWDLSEEEKLDESERLKQRGTDFLQKGKNQLAIVNYKRVVEFLLHETSMEGEKKEKRDNLLMAAYSNMAAVYLKAGETIEAIHNCDKALEMDGKNVKALYRKGQAYQNQNDFEDAIKQYEKVLELEAGNKAAQAAIMQCRNRLAEERKRQKAIFANMFEKLAKATDTVHEKGDAKQDGEMDVDAAPTESSNMNEPTQLAT